MSDNVSNNNQPSLRTHRAEIERLFARFKTDFLIGVGAQAFEANLRGRIGIVDPGSEGYRDAELVGQRDFSIKFAWGHDHDFGSFRLAGEMKDRHLRLMDNFCTTFPIGLDDFRSKEVLDVGCWTGGTTLLLAALGARVTAIEEVKKYADTTAYLAKCFGIAADVRSLSLYSLNDESFYDRFDIVYFPGVIYHLSDPLIALRILFNACKIGGRILVESAGIDVARPLCRFDGSRRYGPGSEEEMSRKGWNWFVPSPSALDRMMREAGFEDVRSVYLSGERRIYAYGVKRARVPICRAGLSVSNIR